MNKFFYFSYMKIYGNNFSSFVVFDYVTLGEIAKCPECCHGLTYSKTIFISDICYPLLSADIICS